MEKLFTNEELLLIENEAKINTEYYLNTTVSNGLATEISIITISKNNRLIFVEGNNDTGYNHLRDRHDYFSFQNYWIKTEDDNVKLDNPSKFNPEMIPMLDYVKIADSIFCDANKSISKNTKPDIFDKYTGLYELEKYHLLTYKNTKIVHTLFPDKKNYNQKRKCKYGKGIVTTVLKFPDGFNDLVVPYENQEGLIAYSILVRKCYSEKTEKILIQKHDKNGNPVEKYLYCYRFFEQFEKFERESMNYFQLGDLSEFEILINKIDEETERRRIADNEI